MNNITHCKIVPLHQLYVCMYVCVCAYRNGAELHVGYNSDIRHGEVECQKCVEVGDAAALTLIYYEDLPPILSLYGMSLHTVQTTFIIHIQAYIHTYIHT